MKCWKDNCKDEVEFMCQCTNPPIYSCGQHLLEHLKIVSRAEHRPESVTILPNPNTKKALIDHLHKSLSNLYELRLKTISDLSLKIKLLSEKMNNTLNCFNDAIRQHNEVISQISKLDNNKINQILTLEPEESIRKLEGILEIFDDSRFFINDEGKIELKNQPNQIIVFRQKTMKLVRVDLKNYSLAEFDISLNSTISKHLSMCLIPKCLVFCYGNWPAEDTAFIIDMKNNINQVISAPVALVASGSVYYKNYVYILGGWDGKPTNNAFKYDLSNKNWTNLNSLPIPSCFVSCTARKNKILLSGREHSKIYCYDIIQNSYAVVHNTQIDFYKFICGNKKNYYVIEMGGNIYESNNEWKAWITIGRSNIEKCEWIGFGALWKNNVYFASGYYNLYEFDLKKKKIKLIKKI